MDPLTHALAGAAVAYVVARDRRALWIGATAALAPDLDVLIRSSADPLLAIEHHRGFSHSLLFAPVGAAVVSMVWRTRAVFAATAAWLSHSLLDASTTYGTQLFWPFSRHRVGLDIISIIDPLFTLIVLAAVIAAYRERGRLVAVMLAVAIAWLTLGGIQRARAMNEQARVAESRGEAIGRREVFPTVGNTIVWRSIYESDGKLRLDRIKVPWIGAPTLRAVTAVPHVKAIDGSAQARRDFERFAWFSNGWVARSPTDPSLIGDARYSMTTDAYEPVWAIRVHDHETEWVDRSHDRPLPWR